MDGINDLQMTSGLTGLFSIVVTLLSIILAWSLLQEIKWEKLLRNPRSPKARMLQVLAAVIVGHWFAQFVLGYWNWSMLLRGFVE
ncbi:DUF1146 domain-containing protein [Paenibacillus thailandensis]|uniref:DUF1146 domain-containing protein n=1 Tax=Paenibacillus thailandensis TaxID=393250 RepID=A0ABW5R3V0_9BACL